MTPPIRVQLRRTKGWRMPLNTVKVDRATRWGNPYRVGGPTPHGFLTIPDAESAVGFFEAMLRSPELRAAAGYPTDLSPLRGKSLACWCPLSAKWCHADVLLREANRQEPPQ